MRTSRTCLLIAMTLALLGSRDVPQVQSFNSSDDAVEVSATSPLQAARLRKLHLVRPDLINYPLSFEVVC